MPELPDMTLYIRALSDRIQGTAPAAFDFANVNGTIVLTEAGTKKRAVSNRWMARYPSLPRRCDQRTRRSSSPDETWLLLRRRQFIFW